MQQTPTTPSRLKISPCQKTSLASIGATKAVRRDFAAPGGAAATQIVARFPDDLTAGYGYQILESWLRSCRPRLADAGHRKIRVPAGYSPLGAGEQAGWAVLSYGPVAGDPRAAYLQAETVVRDAQYLSWVVFRSVGQDYSYPAGGSPPERAAPLLAARLAGLG